MKPSVVVGIDATKNSEEAVVWAAETARSRREPLELVHALGQAVWGVDPDMDRLLEHAGTALLAQRLELVEQLQPKLEVRTVLERDTPARVLTAASKRAALVVVGSGDGRHLARPTGSRSYQVTAAAHCPVAVVPGIPPASASGVVVGVDGSPDGVAAVALGAAEADRTGQRLVVVHAWNDPPLISDGYLMAGMSGRVRELEVVVLAESVAGLAGRYPDLPVAQKLVKGRPCDAILDAARDARLIVVGSRGRRGLSRMLLGSVSHDVLLAARCPVMVTHQWPDAY